MKTQLFFSLLLFVLLALLLCVESIMMPPVVVLFLFLQQQSVLSELEVVSLAWMLGLSMSVLYSIPLAVGVACIMGVTVLKRMQWWESFAQTRDGLMVLLVSSVIGLLTVQRPTSTQLVAFFVYFSTVVLVSRFLARRQRFGVKQR
jgi:hypothetical protein